MLVLAVTFIAVVVSGAQVGGRSVGTTAPIEATVVVRLLSGKTRVGPLGAPLSPQVIENNVVNALFQNKQLALSPEDVEKIRILCVTDQCRRTVEQQAQRMTR
jgi:hypothetical protein